jgi:hypothetical protein
MTIKVKVSNEDQPFGDRAVEVQQVAPNGHEMFEPRTLVGGESVEVYVHAGLELHVKEVMPTDQTA